VLRDSRKAHDVGIPRQKLLQTAFEERTMRNRHLWVPAMRRINHFEHFPRPLDDDMGSVDIPDGPGGRIYKAFSQPKMILGEIIDP
jgi:23S rRNA C2498 (ribose-2'-O)-methylase RlmM